MPDDPLFHGDAPTRSVGPTLGDATGVDPNAPPLLGSGDEFGPYHVVRLLGRGGMGEVYEERHGAGGGGGRAVPENAT